MIAKSMATQRTLLCASKTHRSPFFRPREAKKSRACPIILSKDAACCVSPPSSCKSSSAIRLNQTVQPRAHGRQIILPAPLPFSRRKIRIPPLHFFFKIHTHARHHFQIPHHRPPNSIRNPLAFLAQLE